MTQGITTARQSWGRWLRGWLLGAIALVWGCLGSPVGATGVYDIPTLDRTSPRVFDLGEVVSVATEGKLGDRLTQLAEKTGKEVHLVTLRRLDFGDTIDQFADALFDKWFPTSAAAADQVVLVVDSLTNSIALRTGEAITELIPPDTATSIAQETVGIPIRDGNRYNQALLAASERLGAILSGDRDPGPPQVKDINTEGTFTRAEDTNDRSATVWVVILLIVATVIPMATYYFYVGFPGR